MPNHRLLLLVAAVCLLLASGAAAAEGDAFTATSTPSHVKPATSALYTITLTNDALSPSRAQKAKIAIPTGFAVDPATVGAVSEALGGCIGSTWQPDGPLLANSKINLKRPGGSETGLCPGARLTVSFAAKSASIENTYTWTTQLFIDASTEFLLQGFQPTVVVDGTPPETTINSAPAAATTETSASFAFTSSELGSTFECSLDGAAFAACTSPKNYTGLEEDPHTFAVKATDPAGNTDVSPASESWTVDITAPDTTIASGPPPATNQTSASFTFSSSQEGSTFACSLDGATFAACTSPKSYTGLDEDPHTFAVKATDPAGNTDVSPASESWTVDITAPEATIASGPPPATNQTSASFSFGPTEPGGTFECSLDALDAGTFAPCTSPKSYTGLPGGDRTFRVRAIDAAGNTSIPASHTWRIDLIGAATTILSGPPSLTNSTSAAFVFESSEPGTTFECSRDQALFTACESPIGYSNLGEGAHTFAVRAVDKAHNTGPEASHSWTIDTRPPTASVSSGPSTLSNSRSATFTFSADEPSSLQCSLDGGGLVPCNSPASYAGLGDGTHTFSARPTDAVGNPGAAASYTWTIDATAPETIIGSRPRSGTTAVSATFTFSATEAANFQCKLDAAAFAPCASPKSYAALKRAGHTFEVRAIDPAGNVDPTAAVYRWTIGAALRSARASSVLLAPRAGARVKSPPVLRWRRVARASYYNVQLYRGRVKVLSAWPTSPRLQLRGQWSYLGRQRRLTRGTYRWLVWPRFGGRYGALLGKSTFTVVARR